MTDLVPVERPAILRLPNGKLIKGTAPLPGAGAPKTRTLQARVRAAVADGQELVSFMTGVMRDDKAVTKDRLRAVEWLADRGWGKVPQPVDGDGSGGAVRIRLTWGGNEDASQEGGGE